ncbi:MAG TPA: hypothetical protein GXX28_00810, partial [Firmicutes bacterium]|nr:hypothetical protein [Bacillota bacterium]
MAWVRIDDHFAEHPKVLQVGPLGMALQIAALCYCNRNLTDGFIPWATARTLLSWEFLGEQEERGRKRYEIAATCGMAGETISSEFVIRLLLDAGIWEEVDGGYMIHDYDQYQPTKAEVLAKQAKRSEAGRKAAAARWHAECVPDASDMRNACDDACDSDASPVRKSCPNPDPVPVPDTKTEDEGLGGSTWEGCGEPNTPCGAPPETQEAEVHSLATPDEREILNVLRSVPGYPFSYETDL